MKANEFIKALSVGWLIGSIITALIAVSLKVLMHFKYISEEYEDLFNQYKSFLIIIACIYLCILFIQFLVMVYIPDKKID